MNSVIVAGSRDVVDDNFIEYQLGLLMNVFSFDEVLSGTARGVDQIGERWAEKHDIPVVRFPAQWTVDDLFDRSAGYKRNAKMALEGTHLVAFWDGKSVGTKNMIDQALKQGLDVFVFQC